MDIHYFLVEIWVVIVFLNWNLATSIKMKNVYIFQLSSLFPLGIYPIEITAPVHVSLDRDSITALFLVAKNWK